MIRYLIKNNFKLMLRNKWAVCLMLAGPLITIFLLSNTFSSLMESYEAPDEFTVGYRENGSILSDKMDTVKDAAKEAGIVFSEYPEGEPSELIEKNALSAFVEFGEDEYKLYKSGEHKTEGSITEYFLESLNGESMNIVLDMTAPDTKSVSKLPVSRIDFMPSVDSTDYYGIVLIVYYAGFGMICASKVLGSEKKNGIERKYRVCALTSVQLYLSRLIPAAAVIAVSIFIETVMTALFYGIHWGSYIISAVIVLLVIIAGAAFGLMLYSISRNMAVTVVVMFMAEWFIAFFGGTFETYMFSDSPDILKELSPVYHANRALVEISCMGHSGYVTSAVIYMIALAAVFSAAAVAVDMIRKRGRA